MSRLYLSAATANAWVLILVLAAAFGVQLSTGELPCPLCVVQRIALMMCALGPLHLLIKNRDGSLAQRDVAVGCGIAIVAGLIGAAASSRQVLLHILPGDPGFGSAVLKLHLYTWGLIAFACQIAASALMLLGVAWFRAERNVGWAPATATVVAFAAIVAANLLSVMAEAGWNWDLPSDPVEYLLFK
jgi:disulfide bond formation protein DsbB